MPRSWRISAGRTRLRTVRTSPIVRVGPRRPNRSKQGNEQGWCRKATRSTCEYGWESELPVLAGYLGTPKAEVPRGNQAGRGVAWDHYRLLIPVRTPVRRAVAAEMKIGAEEPSEETHPRGRVSRGSSALSLGRVCASASALSFDIGQRGALGRIFRISTGNSQA